MNDNQQIIDMTLDIMNETSFTLELSGAIAMGLYDRGWRKLEESEWELAEENKRLKARIEEFEDYEASILANDY